MRRPGLGTGVARLALGAISLVEAGRLRDGWLACWAFQNEELAKYLPLATTMGIRE